MRSGPFRKSDYDIRRCDNIYTCVRYTILGFNIGLHAYKQRGVTAENRFHGGEVQSHAGWVAAATAIYSTSDIAIYTPNITTRPKVIEGSC